MTNIPISHLFQRTYGVTFYLELQKHLDLCEHTSCAPSTVLHSCTACYTADSSWDSDLRPGIGAKYAINYLSKNYAIYVIKDIVDALIIV